MEGQLILRAIVLGMVWVTAVWTVEKYSARYVTAVTPMDTPSHRGQVYWS